MTTDRTDIAARYHRLAEAFTATVDAVGDEQWSQPSPCEGWTAHDVLDHVVSTETDFLGGFDETKGLVADLPADARAAWPRVRAAVQQVLDEPALAEHGYDGHFGPTTIAQTVDTFYSLDLMAHRWDLARATGLVDHESFDGDDADRYRTALAGVDDSTLRSPGLFGPEVPVAADASPQDRFLGFTGRQP